MDAVRSDEALDHPPAAAIEQQIRDLRRRRERLLDLAETQDLADDLATRIRSLTARIVQAETEVATARARGEDALDLRATLGQMADIAGRSPL
jgi:uncharacterized protein YlxW (UPF0749 family)